MRRRELVRAYQQRDTLTDNPKTLAMGNSAAVPDLSDLLPLALRFQLRFFFGNIPSTKLVSYRCSSIITAIRLTPSGKLFTGFLRACSLRRFGGFLLAETHLSPVQRVRLAGIRRHGGFNRRPVVDNVVKRRMAGNKFRYDENAKTALDDASSRG